MKKNLILFYFTILCFGHFFAQSLPCTPTPNGDSLICGILIDEPIRLTGIYFDYNDAKILPFAEKHIAYLANIMNTYPELIVEIGVHTDSRGKDVYNEDLSQRRADSVVDFLVEKLGIDASRLNAVGYGESEILNRCTDDVKDCSDEEHRFNRRTEFKIIKGPEKTRITMGLK